MKLIWLIVLGFALGPTVLSIPYPNFFKNIAPVAGALYLFVAGLELDFKSKFVSPSRSIKLTIPSFVIPFLVGWVYFPNQIFVAFALSITALPVIIQILKDKKMLHTKLGFDVVLVASFCDLVSWIAIAFLIPEKNLNTWLTSHWPILFFLIGAAASLSESKLRFLSLFQKSQNWILGPVFFVSMGWGLKESLHSNLNLILIILALGFVGKLIGGYCAGRWVGYSHREAIDLGLLVNIRGAMEIVAAHYALQAGLVDVPLYSALVLLSLISTVFAVPFVKKASS